MSFSGEVVVILGVVLLKKAGLFGANLKRVVVFWVDDERMAASERI